MHGHTVTKVSADIILRFGDELAVVYPPSAHRCAATISDATVALLYGDAVAASLRGAGYAVTTITVAPGEESKHLAEAERIYRTLAAECFGRDGVIVALGGGVVSDLAGFVAGTWMRGVSWAICPTTLQAQIDAAIGGKTAVNVPGGKNLVGVFHPPGLVAIDPKCLATLPPQELAAGLAESVKHALIGSEEFLRWHEQNTERILALDHATIVALIERNIAIKTAVVDRDPREETGERQVLNFGHTIGHAIEEGGGFALRHGECVAIGMVAACRLSHRMGLLDESVTRRLEDLLRRFGLPTRIPKELSPDRLLKIAQVDKKARGGRLRFVLLEGVGRAVVRGDIEEETVLEVLRSL